MLREGRVLAQQPCHQRLHCKCWPWWRRKTRRRAHAQELRIAREGDYPRALTTLHKTFDLELVVFFWQKKGTMVGEAKGAAEKEEDAIVEMLERELRLMESDYRRTLQAEPVRVDDSASRSVWKRTCSAACTCTHETGRR